MHSSDIVPLTLLMLGAMGNFVKRDIQATAYYLADAHRESGSKWFTLQLY